MTQTFSEYIRSMNRAHAVQWVKHNHGVSTRLAIQIIAVEYGEAVFGDTFDVSEINRIVVDRKRYLRGIKRRRKLKKRTLSW